jgi:uncharacterized protein YecT (DUF1311 family)
MELKMPRLPLRLKQALIVAALGGATFLAVNPARAHDDGYRRPQHAAYKRLHHPSFDCSLARLAAERTICADRALSRTDMQTSHLYDEVIHQAGQVSDAAAVALIRKTQRAFLNERNACGANHGCIEGEYRAIERQLRAYMHQLD